MSKLKFNTKRLVEISDEIVVHDILGKTKPYAFRSNLGEIQRDPDKGTFVMVHVDVLGQRLEVPDQIVSFDKDNRCEVSLVYGMNIVGRGLLEFRRLVAFSPLTVPF